MTNGGVVSQITIETGLERLASNPDFAKKWGRTALLANQASLTSSFVPSWAVCSKVLGKNLKALMGPQHGFEATCQDNMIESTHARHLPTGLPVYSLYSETREPTDEMLKDIDTILIDIQIVGCRIYTFKSTIAGCLRSAKRLNKKVVVLDRPNPLGGEILEGRILDEDAKSFVGQFATPMRHGLTAAESALFFNKEIGADLSVIQMNGWNAGVYWHQLSSRGFTTSSGGGSGMIPWVLTSPNLPTIDSVYVYPGMVIFEATNISEGRGTGQPFQFIGAPYIKDAIELKKRICDIYRTAGLLEDAGVFLRPCSFQPTSQKWAGEECSGVHIHVLDPIKVRSFTLALAILRAFIELGGDKFRWKDPPYEYDFKTLPIKLILGSHEAPNRVMDKKFSLVESFWGHGIEEYKKNVSSSLLYKRSWA